MNKMTRIACLFILLLFLCSRLSETETTSNHNNNVVDSKDSSSLERALQKASGYYTDPLRSAANGLEKTVVVTVANFAFVDHLQNFKCFADRLGVKFLLLALDARTHHYATKRGMHSYHYSSHGGPQASNNVKVVHIGEQAANFQDKRYNQITRTKKHGVADILELGYDVLFTDSDVAWVRDPINFVRFSNIDYVHSVNVLCPYVKFSYGAKQQGNTGFYFMKSSKASVSVMTQAQVAFAKFPHLDDQTVFWDHFIKELNEPVVMFVDPCTHISLANISTFRENHNISDSDECTINAGALHRYADSTRSKPPVRNDSFQFITIHANFMLNMFKEHYMRARGLWLATRGAYDVKEGTNQTTGERFWDGPCKQMINKPFNVFPLSLIDNATVKIFASRDRYVVLNGGTNKCKINDDRMAARLGLDPYDFVILNKDEMDAYPTVTC